MLKLIPGRIINIGSIIADTGYSGLSVYAASKSALEGFSRSLVTCGRHNRNGADSRCRFYRLILTDDSR